MKKRRPTTWSDIYYRYVRRGEDQLSAGYRADEWERRKQRKKKLDTTLPKEECK